MAKLLNKKTIQYIKQGYVLYGQKGIDINKFDDWYWSTNSLKQKYRELYEKINPEPINKNPEFTQFYKEELDKYNKTFNENYQKFFNDNFIKYNDGYYYKKTSNKGKEILFEQELQPTKYPNYFRDSQGQLYKVNTSTYASNKPRFFKVSEDIKYGDRVILKAVEPPSAQKGSSGNSSKFKNFGKYHIDQDAAYGDYNGKKIAVRYNKNNKTWKYHFIDNKTNGWINADQDLSKYLNSLYSDDFTKTATNTTNVTTPENAGGNTNTGNTGGNAGDNTNQVAPGATPEGPPTSDFEALNVETDRRTIVPSVVSQLQVSQASPSMRLLPKVKPVARPKDMPLMNRSDVRYTINDVTGDSPYFSSDIELVNGLAKAPDDNMFKQALMNRLGMDKWDNSTALNRLNYLGIKGNIGGSDRKRLRNLINKGTTIEGTIRKKQGGKLKLIKRYG